MKFEVDFTDPITKATSPIDNIEAPESYTAEDYIKDCENATDQDYIDMIKSGKITLVPVENDNK